MSQPAESRFIWHGSCMHPPALLRSSPVAALQLVRQLQRNRQRRASSSAAWSARALMLLTLFVASPALVSAPKVPKSALVALRLGERLVLTSNEILDVADPSMIVDADCLSSK